MAHVKRDSNSLGSVVRSLVGDSLSPLAVRASYIVKASFDAFVAVMGW